MRETQLDHSHVSIYFESKVIRKKKLVNLDDLDDLLKVTDRNCHMGHH